MKQLITLLFLSTTFSALTAANTGDEAPVRLVMVNGTPSVKVDALTQSLINLGHDYRSELRAIKNSRIAPAMQQQRIDDLNQKYSDLRSSLTRPAQQTAFTSFEEPQHLVLEISDEGTVHEVATSFADSVTEESPEIQPIYNEDTKEKLDSLNLQFEEDMKLVEDSISDPDEQDTKLKELSDKFEEAKSKIISESSSSTNYESFDLNSLVSRTLPDANLDANKRDDEEVKKE